ncbi:MAG: hypothetical protein HY303_18045 [Candidatus Wallbacteria bacterium]|nr:hypothetical protein [Candidatus Wallbacteria bacterium]
MGGNRSRSGQALPAALAVGMLIAAIAVYLLRDGEAGSDPAPEIRIRYATDLKAAMPSNRLGAPRSQAPPLPARTPVAGPPAAHGSVSEGGADAAPHALLSALAVLAANPRSVLELGTPDGDFAWTPETGWQRYEPAPGGSGPGRLVSVDWKDLPEEVRRRHPGTAPAGMAPALAERAAADSGSSGSTDPDWILNPLLQP